MTSRGDGSQPRRNSSTSQISAMSLRAALTPFGKRFTLAGVYFLGVFIVGTVGYKLVEDWGWLEAFYMSVTTVTSVGFMEVRPLSPVGRTLTMGLIALGITGLGIWWALTTALIVELDLGGVLRRRKIMRTIEALNNHFIVCGVGRMGRVVVTEMMQAGHDFVVVENNPDRVATLVDSFPDILVIEGDATREQTLHNARVDKALGLAACLAEDADNLLVCITARSLNPRLTTVARAYNEESVEKLRRVGADHVVSPNFTGGIRMAFTLLRPHVVNFLDCVITEAGIELRLGRRPYRPNLTWSASHSPKPRSHSAPASSCSRYVARARLGRPSTIPVPKHASGQAM